MNRKILTAIATLVAAFSVAVAIAAAPANAGVVDEMYATLTIVPAGNGYHYVTVSGAVRTDNIDEAQRLYIAGCRVVFRLWGDDPVWDNLLLNTSPMGGYESRYGQYRYGLYFEGFLTAPPGLLNEDWGGDEVYAGVRLVGCSTSRSAQSNTVYGNF